MTIQEATASPDFKRWLVTALEPICDAEPDVLADYFIAWLLTDSDPARAQWTEEQWEEYAANDLLDFLGEHAKPFSKAAFDTIRSKSYLPQAAAPVPTVGVKEPTAHPLPTNLRAGVDVVPQRADVEMGEGGPKTRQRCRDYHERGYCMRGANCQFEHSDDVIIPTAEMMFASMGNFMPPQPQRGGFRGRGRGRGGRGGGPMPFDPNMPMGGPGMPPMFFPVGPGGPGGPGGRPAPPPEFALGASRPPRDRNGNTLLITDIPREHTTMAALTDYFGQFGDVTNVAIEGNSRRALVSFTSNAEAYQAWKSDQAVFGNRHVKVLWHKPLPGHGEAGQKALAASKQLLENMKKIEAGENLQGGHVAKLEGPESRLRKTLAELETKERQQKKETLIAEQKVLFARAATASQEDKMTILARLKDISKEMADADKPPPDADMSDKDKLDAQLAKHGMETTAGKDEEELLKLNAQLTSLRDKASTLGIPSTRYSPYGRGSPRGRARGRGRGRGGFRGPMSLDNRSKSVHISGDGLASEGSQEAVVEWYRSTGGSVEHVTDGVVVTYPSREMAEKALARGTAEIPRLEGEIKTSWHGGGGGGGGEIKHVVIDREEGEYEVEMADDSERRERDE